ncbi:MAG: LamG domain-containing protein [Candidatus Altiarchaeota archaeon]|nr:LamG domain-containing protein [Candidatus Altiarchaeota archaeon]
MKGISSSIVSVLLLLISLATVTVFYNQFGKLSSESMAQGEKTLVNTRMAPKYLGGACSTEYGYILISTDEPLDGKLYYVVKDGLDEIASGFSSINITDVGKVYFNATLEDGSEYTIQIRSRYWSFQEKCEASQDSSLVVFISFNESQGTTAKDWSLNGNTAYLNASWVNGTSDYALRFDGLKQKASINSTTGFDAREFTLAFWSLKEYPSSDDESFIEGGSFYVRSKTNGNVQFGLSGGSSLTIPTENKTWIHFTMRYDGGSLDVFRNCTKVDSISSSYSPSLGDLYFAKGPTQYLVGSVDEFYFFSRALEDAEIPAFCNPLLNIDSDAYNGTWTQTDDYCPPEDPTDPDCLII